MSHEDFCLMPMPLPPMTLERGLDHVGPKAAAMMPGIYEAATYVCARPALRGVTFNQPSYQHD